MNAPVGTGPGSVDAHFRAAVTELVLASHTMNPGALAATVNRAVATLGIDVNVLVIDYEQRALRQLPDAGKPTPPATPVDSSPAGQAFASITPRHDPERNRLWLPILDGTERLGVLEVTLPHQLRGDDAAVRRGCEALAGLIGHLLQSKSGLGDGIEMARRSRPMSVASELLLQLVPPTTFACDQLVLSAVLEPTYDVGGDAFDYSVDGSTARVAIFDALGHGLPACLTSSVAVSAIRTARRTGQGLVEMGRAADTAIQSQWTDLRFVTAVLAELDLDSGTLRYVNAGHPPPLVLRGRRVVHELAQGRRLPLGLDDPSDDVAEVMLVPGYRVLFYTDGVIEARSLDSALFGRERLIERTERHARADLATAEILRLLSHAVLEHQAGPLSDDATLLLAEWSPNAARRARP